MIGARAGVVPGVCTGVVLGARDRVVIGVCAGTHMAGVTRTRIP